MTTAFSYPSDLAARVEAEWPPDAPRDPLARHRARVFEVGYQASMVREEERAVRLRILLAIPADFADDDLHYLPFERSRPFDVDELRRLSAAVPFETSLVVVAPDEDEELRILGIMWSGANWLAPTWGGRGRSKLSLPRTVVHVGGPGRVAAYAGARFVASLERGGIASLATDVFASSWMPALFEGARAELVSEHESERDAGRASIDPSLVRTISQQMLRRALWSMRAAHHGGMILCVEPDALPDLQASTLRAKYAFAEGEPRRRYRTLLRRVTEVMTRGRVGVVTDREFAEASQDLVDLEAAIFEIARLVAALSAVDGAVLMTKRLEIVGFGVEVLAGVSSPARVRRALDAEGRETVPDHEENVGTRHRAAYRFVQAHPRGLAIVVSQDGTVRFVTNLDDEITYFEQHIAG